MQVPEPLQVPLGTVAVEQGVPAATLEPAPVRFAQVGGLTLQFEMRPTLHGFEFQLQFTPVVQVVHVPVTQ